MENEIALDFHPYWGRIWNRSDVIQITNQDILKNVLIASNNRGDRHDLMMFLPREVDRCVPSFSTLYINLNPALQCIDPFFDKQYRYGSNDFRVPYYVDIEYHHNLESFFRKCSTALFDFHPEMNYDISQIYRRYKTKGFPPSIIDFLRLLKRSIQTRTYGKRLTQSFIKSIEDAMMFFKQNKTLEHTLRCDPPLPEWLDLWRSKKCIWLDLSQCEPRIQKILVAVIFHALLKVTEYYENYWEMNGVVLLNDAEKVFRRLPWNEYKASYQRNKQPWKYIQEMQLPFSWELYLTKEEKLELYGDVNFLFESQLHSFYHYIFNNEFRYRNISLFTGVRSPENVHKFIERNSQLRFLQCPDGDSYFVEKPGVYDRYENHFGKNVEKKKPSQPKRKRDKWLKKIR